MLFGGYLNWANGGLANRAEEEELPLVSFISCYNGLSTSALCPQQVSLFFYPQIGANELHFRGAAPLSAGTVD